MKRLFAVSGIILTIAGGINAAPPVWWGQGDPPVVDPAAEVNNHGMANIGQAKWMAKSALEAIRVIQPNTADAIEAELVGSGKPIASWDAPATQEQRDAQHAPLLIGQLKAIAAPFYFKLHDLDSAWLDDQLTQNQTKDVSDSANFYPWSSATTDDDNKAAVTIGQLKAVFSLRLETLAIDEDQDNDGLPDAWEIANGLDPTDDGSSNAANGWSGDLDGDGVSNSDELSGNSDPNNAGDFPVQVIQITKGASGRSNMVPYEPPREPYMGIKQSGRWWTNDGYEEIPVTDAAVTPVYLDSVLEGIAFPATPPTPPQDKPWLVPQSNLARSNIYCSSRVNRPPTGNGIESGVTASRVWIKAPTAPGARTFVFVKSRDYSTHVHVTESNPTNINTYTFVSAEVVTATIPANETISNPIDLKYLAPILDGCDVTAYERLEPVALKDIKGDGDADDQVIEPMQPVPTQNQGETDQAFWQRRNAYFQQQIPDRSIAYIEPHGAANGTDPEMPHLVANLPGGPQELTVKWRLEIDYQRLNGWRAPYVDRGLHLEEDLVRIPAGQQATFTAEMDASEEWRIFESQDWRNEINQRGFFGGTAKLYLWFPSLNQTAPTEPVITFRIGGKNPNPAIAKTFIQSHLCDNRLWFAYAIAKKESPNYDKPFYNQFFGSTRKASPLDQNGNPVFSSGFDENKDWQCWAKGWPVFNIDRESRNGPLTSAGGYGIFQVTGDAQSQWTMIPRRQIWNWQDNVGYQHNNVWYGAMGILKAKIQIVDARYGPLQQTYPNCGSIPNYPLTTTSNHKRFSGWDAYTCKAYNGFGGTLPKVEITGFSKPQYSVWHPKQTHWEYKDDDYTLGVWNQVEETTAP